jgi:hypothetical protein
MHHGKHMSRDHYPPRGDVSADTENTASSIVACWTVLTELLPANTLTKSVTLCYTNILFTVSVHCLVCTSPFTK